MSQSQLFKYTESIDYLGDFPGAERERDRLRVLVAAGSVDVTDRAQRALGKVSVTGTPIEDALASEGLDHLLVGQEDGEVWAVEQQSPVAVENTSGTQVDPATDTTLTNTLAREIATWSAGTLPVEQQTPVSLEDTTGTAVDPATEATLSALASALASNGGDTLQVSQQGVVDVSSRDGRNHRRHRNESQRESHLAVLHGEGRGRRGRLGRCHGHVPSPLTMSGLATLVSGYVLPVAVLVSAAATTATATFAWKTWQAVNTHDRALFGEPEVNGHDGIVEAVNENTERSERNRRVLRAHDLVPRGQGDFYRDESSGDDERAT